MSRTLRSNINVRNGNDLSGVKKECETVKNENMEDPGEVEDTGNEEEEEEEEEEGDTGEDEDTCDEEEEKDTPVELEKLEQAVKLMTYRDYIGALMLLTEACMTCEYNDILYRILVKRSKCLFILEQFENSLMDSLHAINLNMEKTIPYFRSVRCYINLGQVDDAEDFLNANKEFFAYCDETGKFRNDIQKIRNVKDDVYENSRNYLKCFELLDDGLDLAPASVELMAFKIKYLLLLDDHEAAKNVDKQINKRCGQDINVFEAWNNYYDCLFDQCDFKLTEKSIKLGVIDDMLDKAAEFRINFKSVKNEMIAKNYEVGVSILHELFECDHTNHKAYLKICKMLLECYKNMKNQEDNVIKYATKMLEFNPKKVNALLARAEAFQKIKLLDNALIDLKRLLKIEKLPNDLRKKCEKIIKDIKKAQTLKKEADENVKRAQEKAKEETAKNPVNLKKAEAFNTKGNNQYKSKLFVNAIHHYTDAIQQCSTVAKYYSNRCACYMALANFESGVRDAVKAVEVDTKFLKGYSRAINCYLVLGNVNQARFYIDKLQKNIDVGIESIKYIEIPKVEEVEEHHKQIVKFMDEKNYDESLKHLEAALKIATACKQYNIWMAECFLSRAEINFKSQNYPKSFEDCSLILRLKINEKDENCIKALILRARIHCKQKDFEDAVIDCDEVLRLIGTVSKYKDEVDALKVDARFSSLHRDVRNYYEILRIPRNSPMAVIREAFKNLSLVYHSDKHPDATPIEKKKLEIRFQQIKTAFECLKVQHEC